MPLPVFVSDPTYLLLVMGALFVHACYQLSVSVLTHFTSHSLSRQTSEKRLLTLGLSYSLGAIITTTLIICTAATLVSFLHNQSYVMVAVVGIAPLIGLATMLWYYRRGEGTRIWLPRSFAAYLLERSKKTRSLVEAAMLGSATVVGELPFLIGPLLFITYLVAQLPLSSWVTVSGLYSFLAYLPLLFVTMYITSGHSVARVQRWRETNKSFLQWTSGIALVLLSVFITVMHLGAV